MNTGKAKNDRWWEEENIEISNILVDNEFIGEKMMVIVGMNLEGMIVNGLINGVKRKAVDTVDSNVTKEHGHGKG